MAASIEEILGLRFGISQSEVKATVESQGGTLYPPGTSPGTRSRFPCATGFRIAGVEMWETYFEFREDKLVSLATNIQPEPGKTFLQQYEDWIRRISEHIGEPGVRRGHGVKMESIWMNPIGAKPSEAIFLQCFMGNTLLNKNKAPVVKLAFIPGGIGDQAQVAQLTGFIALASSSAQSTSQTTQHPATENLANALVGYIWSWDPEGKNDGTVQFFPNGTAKHSRVWTATWKLDGSRTVVLTDIKDPKKTSKLDFDVAGERFVGGGFSGKALIRGSRLERITGQTPSVASSAPQVATLALGANWDTPMQGGTNTLADLGRLFSPVAKPATNLAADPTIEVYDGVRYLMPFQEAIKPLGITSRPPSKNLIACPGFPRESLFYYAADGNFEGHYNRMYVVVDRADQVVSVQLVDEKPREKPDYIQDQYDWTTYNFVNARTKAMNKLKIYHKLSAKTKLGWNLARVEPTAKMYRVDSWLINPAGKNGGSWDMKEQVRWYVPKPLVELILTCVQAGGR